MYENKIINEADLLKENQDLLKGVMAGIRRRLQVSQSSKKWRAYQEKRN